MRPLLTATGLGGLLLGVACAVAWHYAWLRSGGWFAYSPLSGEIHVSWENANWLPEVIIGPVAGLLLGLGAGWLLAWRGWRLVRGQW